MNVTDDIVTRLRGTLPADGTLVTEHDRLCAHAAAVIELLRGDVGEAQTAIEVQHHRRIEAELRALHRTEAVGASLGYRYWCDCLGCGGVWPCPTIRILDGGEQCAPATSPATSTR